MEKKQPGKLLDSFWSLSSLEEQERLKSGLIILKHVKRDQEKETPFVLERLVRGVASSRAGAYNGFFPCLTSLLQVTETKNEAVLKLIKKIYPLNDESLKKHEGEQLVGMMLSLGALIRIRCGTMTAEQIETAFRALLKIRTVKTFLAPMSLVFLLHILSEVDEDIFESTLWPVLMEGLETGLGEISPEDLAMLLKAETRFHGTMKRELKNRTGSKKVVCDDHLQAISTAVLKTRNHLPACHPLLDVLGEVLVKKKVLGPFWELCVDGELVNKHERGKGQVAFYLAAAALPYADNAEKVSTILSKRLIGEFMWHSNHFGTKEPAIVKFTDALTNVLDHSEPDVTIACLEALFTPPGTILIDQITRARLIARVAASNSTNSEVVKCLTAECHAIILGANPEHHHSHRKHAAQLLSRLSLHPSMMGDVAWQTEQLCFLMSLGMFRIQGSTTYLETAPQGLPDAVMSILRDSFCRASDHPRLSLPVQCTILWDVVQEANRLLNSDHARLVSSGFTDEVRKHWRSVVKLLPKLEKEMGSVFRLLFLHILLQMLTSPTETLPTLQELMTCYEKAVSASEQEEIPWVEVVTDMLLSLLSSKKHVMRTVANHTFKMLVPYVTLPAILSILEAINPSSEPLEEEGKSDAMEEDGSEGDSDESEEEESDESMDEGSDSDSDEEDSEKKDLANGDVDPQFLASVKKALGPAAVESGDEEMDLTDIDDDTAREIDDALAQVFRQRGGKVHKEDRKKKLLDTQVMHFRIRCVELLETYLKTAPKLSHVVEILPGLFSALELACRDSKLEPLRSKLRSAIKAVTQTTKTEADSAASIPTVLKDLVKRAHRLFEDNELELVTKCSTYLARCAINTNKRKIRVKAKDVYVSSFKKFFDKGDCPLRYSYFSEVLSLPWTEIWELSDMLLEHAFEDAHRAFKRKQAVALLRVLLRNQGLIALIELEQRKEFAQKVVNLSAEFVNKLRTEETPLKEMFMQEVMELCSSCCKNYSVDSASLFQALALLKNEKLSKLGKKKPSVKRLQKACNRLINSGTADKSLKT